MFIQEIKKKTKNKVYSYPVLMENYREGGKVKHRILANLSKWPQKLIEDFDKLLKGQVITDISDLEIRQGKSIGGIFVVSRIAKRLGISQALGTSMQAKLTMIQIASRVLNQGSRLYISKEWKNVAALEEVFKIKDFDHHDLYQNLLWLSQNQEKIEKKLFEFRHPNKKISQIFFYDITSSYLEGDKNELAAYGYNRDKKQGKKQIVIGLMTDGEGYPISVEVFNGNKADMKTVSDQLKKLKENFGVEQVVFVGDKGMIKSAQISEIEDYKWYYLTSITKEQIKKLISEKVLSIDLFSQKVFEVKSEAGIRYILHRNPYRAEAIRENRESKISKIKSIIEQENEYLQEHKRAKVETALKRITQKIERLGLEAFLIVKPEGRKIELEIDEAALERKSMLDGCYVIKTNAPSESLDTETAHARYKDLSKVEFAFRTMKTTFEEVRPVYVRKEGTTRGHVFVAMLAYIIIKYVTEALQELEMSRKHIFDVLDKINYLEYEFRGEVIKMLPKKLLPEQEAILKKLNVKLKV